MARIPTPEEWEATSIQVAGDWLSEAFPDQFAALHACEKAIGKPLSLNEQYDFARICARYAASTAAAGNADDLRQAKKLVAALRLSTQGILREVRDAQVRKDFATAPSTPEWDRKLLRSVPSRADYQQALKDLASFANRTPRVFRIVEICHRARSPAVETVAMWNRIERRTSRPAPASLLNKLESITKQRERRLSRFLNNWSRCVGASVGPQSDAELHTFIRRLGEFWREASGQRPTARWNSSMSKPVGPFSRLLISLVAAFPNRPPRCASDEALIKRAARVLRRSPIAKSSDV